MGRSLGGMTGGEAGFGRRAIGAALLAFGLLAGCAGRPAPEVAAAPPVSVTPADPVVAFAAAPPASGVGVVDTPGGGPATPARITRSYSAASGRQCREVLVGSGAEERTQVACNIDGQWLAARPLLRGGVP